MAIDSKVYSQHQFLLAIAEQSAFGTANTTQDQFLQLHLTNRPEIESSVVEDATRRATGSVVMETDDHYRTTAGGEYTIPVEGVLTVGQAAYLLFGALQHLTSEGGTAPYAKVFTLGTGVTVPPTPNFVFTTLIYDPSGENRQIKDCVFKSLKLAFVPGSAGGRVTFSGVIYSGAKPSTSGVTATPASWDAPGSTYFGASALDTFTIDVGGGALDLVCYGWNLTVDNGAKRFGFDGSGDGQGIAIGAGPAGITVTGEIVTKYDDNTEGLEAAFYANTGFALAINYYNSSDTQLTLAMNCKINQPKKDFGNEAGVGVTVPFMGVYSGSTAALVATIEDGVDRGW